MVSYDRERPVKKEQEKYFDLKDHLYQDWKEGILSKEDF